LNRFKPAVILLILLNIAPVQLEPALQAAQNPDLSVFRKIISTRQKINTIDAEIEQTVKSSEDGSEKFRGRYRADNSGKFRIDYTRPEKQLVYGNGKKLYWYYPMDSVLYETPSTGMNTPVPGNSLTPYMTGLDKRYRVKKLGRSLYGFFSIAERFRLTDIKTGKRVFFWFDSAGNRMLRKVVEDSEGREILKEVYSDYRKVNNISFPHRVDVFIRTAGGITQSRTNYTAVRVNGKLRQNVFDIVFPRDAERRRFNGK